MMSRSTRPSLLLIFAALAVAALPACTRESSPNPREEDDGEKYMLIVNGSDAMDDIWERTLTEFDLMLETFDPTTNYTAGMHRRRASRESPPRGWKQVGPIYVRQTQMWFGDPESRRDDNGGGGLSDIFHLGTRYRADAIIFFTGTIRPVEEGGLGQDGLRATLERSKIAEHKNLEIVHILRPNEHPDGDPFLKALAHEYGTGKYTTVPAPAE